MKLAVSFFCMVLSLSFLNAQETKADDTLSKYLFYLHGGIVQQQGAIAVSKTFGPYLYNDIVDSLRSKGFIVLSEVRPHGTDEKIYAGKIAGQVDSLLKTGVGAGNIVIAGASQGAWIAFEVALLLKNPSLNFVVLGICNNYNMNYFSSYKKQLCGRFLSIYESSDTKQSCDLLLKEMNCKTGYTEVQLDMGLGHGFIFRPYKEWIDPLVKWME